MQAKPILTTPSTISQTTIDQFKGKFMTTPNKYYVFSRTGNGLVCSCPDNQFHKSDCKYIHVILDISKQNKVCTNNKLKSWTNKTKPLQILYLRQYEQTW